MVTLLKVRVEDESCLNLTVADEQKQLSGRIILRVPS